MRLGARQLLAAGTFGPLSLFKSFLGEEGGQTVGRVSCWQEGGLYPEEAKNFPSSEHFTTLKAGRFRSAQEPRSGTMASIPSSGSLMATHNYRRRRLSSTSSTSSCSSEYSGEVIPHGPDLPKSDPGQWWASFFFGKTTHPAMTTVSESQESLGALRVATGPMACALVAAPGAGRRRHVSESSAGPSV
ncbi:pancreatic progenitor cell differentiation and proliferation factor isoform X1 [Corvus cornix cornix]|uniref:pancreatic progenitor cell differentiation and proliferation factor isoform X1 n=1 Tax=Corvus cornix cornix TaxID=932674 RepID=UPI0019511DD2|nr:pancreatic progenitor cell differentiation and proliferation factor isoform X1 [Corvus cornix cornix]